MKSTAIANSTSDSPTCGTKPPPKLRVLKDYSVEVGRGSGRTIRSGIGDHFCRTFC